MCAKKREHSLKPKRKKEMSADKEKETGKVTRTMPDSASLNPENRADHGSKAPDMTPRRGTKLGMIIPCYNEQEVLPENYKRLSAKMQDLIRKGLVSADSLIVYVDDGSKDTTWAQIAALHGQDQMVRGIKLSRNRGHQNALLAGLMTLKSECDMLISMDADLQDDIEVLDEFILKYLDGCDVVYGVRSARDTDTFFKKNTAHFFYSLMNRMGAQLVYDHADYRLMSRRALEALGDYGEVNLFLRGIVPLIGFKSDTVTYERHERFAGESKYPLKKMISFAVDGITSLSVQPIRLVTTLGIMIFLISIIMLIYDLIVHFTGGTVRGWTSLVVSIWALGGLQLLAIGIIGEYIGKIYLETKRRPRFIVETYLGGADSTQKAEETV